MSEAPTRNSSRPPPLRLSKESRKIRKQQLAPTSEAKSHHHPPPPVIIYSVSPKKIYVDQNEFMSLVQRLTGRESSSSPTVLNAPPEDPGFPENGGGVSIETQVSDGMPQDLFLHANDSIPLSCLPHMNIGLHGNMNVNNYVENNLIMDVPSPSNVDIFNSFSGI